MSLDEMFANKLVLAENSHQTRDIIQYEIFHNNLDIYDSENRYIILGVPNIQCKVYFDDEDFIYAKLGLSETDYIDFTVTNYLAQHNIILDFSTPVIEGKQLYAKILYLYQFASVYYGSLSGLRPRDRISSMPNDLLIWLDNVVNIIRVVIDNDLFNLGNTNLQNHLTYNESLDATIKQILELNTEPTLNKQVHIDTMTSSDIMDITDDITCDQRYTNELIIGLNLVICHLKMLLNHYKIKRVPLPEIDEKHIKKLFKLINNMCIIIIHLRHNFIV
jgi:hypothetical protein